MNAKQNSGAVELDQLLSSFFKAQMPSPFPGLKLPAAGTRTEMPLPASRDTLYENRVNRMPQGGSKSRLALAVSVALLLGSCWYLSGQIGNAPERPLGGNSNGTATVPKEIKKATEEANKSNNMP